MEARTEEEYAALIRDFLKQHSVKIIVTIALVGSASGGWFFWQSRINANLDQAASLYYSVFKAQEESVDYLNNQREERPEPAVSAAQAVKAAHPDSVYALFASLYLAKLHVNDEDFDAAVTELEWALGQAKDATVRDMVRGRIARIRNAQDRTRSALAALEGLETETARAMAAELKGDAFYLEGKEAEARGAYLEANLAPPDSGQSVVVEWKLHAWPSAKALTIQEAKDRRNNRRYRVVSSPVSEPEETAEVTPVEAAEAPPVEAAEAPPVEAVIEVDAGASVE